MSVIDAIAIGRNEGERLLACLSSLQGVRRVIYVDSGSTDGSVQAARAAGAEVVDLDLSIPFTAARARNAGLMALDADPPDLVQVIDGDCILQPGWLEAASAFLAENPDVAVVCGRRREEHPEASLYNRLIDTEWDTPVGQAEACGGDALMRYGPVREVGGYRNDLIAGEEPEMCLRLRKAGWTIWRLDAEMTLHDAKLLRFGQWWKRSERAGHAFAEGAARFSTPDMPHWQAEAKRSLAWGALIPVVVLVTSLGTPLAVLLALVYPLQVLRLKGRLGWAGAFFTTLGKFPEAIGALRFHLRRLLGGNPRLIEYR
jgi:GT2 family glycosyltransferase